MMGLWNPYNRAMAAAAGACVLAAFYAVAAWGQAGGHMAGGQQLLSARSRTDSPTVTVEELRVPESAWKHFQRAKSAADRHRVAEFEKESARALEIAPNFASMYLLRATVEVGACRYEEAVASAQAAAHADPGAMWTAVVQAGAYNGMHRFKDALAVLDAKQGFESQTWQATYERARAEIGLGHIPAAMHWSGMALGAAPQEFIDAHLVRANALLLAGSLDAAAAQMDLYLGSKQQQLHRIAVAALREAVTARIAAAHVVDLRARLGTGLGTAAQPEIASR